jgi:phosphoribosylformylglycinamidine synthase
MLWEVEITPVPSEVDREGAHVVAEARRLGLGSIREVRAGKSFLIQTDADEAAIQRAAAELLVDPVVEKWKVRKLSAAAGKSANGSNGVLLNVLFKPGVTDNVALSTRQALQDSGLATEAVSTCRTYHVNGDASDTELKRLASRVLANDAIEHVITGPLHMDRISLGSGYQFQLTHVAIRGMDDKALMDLSRTGQLSCSLPEMQTIQKHYVEQQRDPTDVELETIAQTWSEHCSHKTLAGRIHYRDDERDIHFKNMLKETIFAATVEIRRRLGDADWCVSVFRDNAGVVKFDDEFNVCFKAETHNHPSAIEPYGGANTGLGGVIRDPLGTGLGAKPVCNTDVFCFAPPDTPDADLPPGVLHPKVVARGVVSGVRDYGNRMGIPTVNGAIVFDPRYIGNPLVYCGNIALIPIDQCEKRMQPGDWIVAVGGRTGRDGIHGATFSSIELDEHSETVSGGAVQIGNAIVEKMVADVILAARDRGLYSSITDCGAGGFSSAVGEMGADTGAEVWLDKAPLKYAGLSYTEIWISEAQERMVLAVPQKHWDEFHKLCDSEGVEATIIGQFTNTHRLVLKYHGEQVADLSMDFLHEGRPPVVREAVWEEGDRRQESRVRESNGATKSSAATSALNPESRPLTPDLLAILGSLNVCSKEWVIRQYDHEVQAGSVVKPLVGVCDDGPSDAAVVRPVLTSNRGLAVSCGINPRFGDLDPYWMAASAIDEAVRNCIAVGANPERIAILDNFCWGNTQRPETLGSLVRAALGCRDVAIAFGTPFISGKDSLNNEFSYVDKDGVKQTVVIPSSLLISALGQMDDVNTAVTMDAKEAGNAVYLVGETKDELGGSHLHLVRGTSGGAAPRVDLERAPKIFAAMHKAISAGQIRACHDLSEGGLAVAAAESAFSGGLGLELDLAALASSKLSDETLLFSESNTRFLVEVPADRTADFERTLAGLPVSRLGKVTTADRLVIRSGAKALIDAPLAELKEAWQSPLRWD